jgi:diadenosine tetraphosphate (Ap4A) HIT family hydrolase
VLCRVVDGSPDVPFASVMGVDRLAEQTLLRTATARVIVDVAPVVVGHVLIITHHHAGSVAACTDHQLREILELKERLTSVFERKFGIPPVWFEHGECDQARADSCRIYHSHLHGIPAPATVFDQLRHDITFHEVAGLQNVARLTEGRSYLYLETESESRVRIVERPPSQIFRRAVCDALGSTERWNWHDQVLLHTEQTRRRIEGTLERFVDVGEEL